MIEPSYTAVCDNATCPATKTFIALTETQVLNEIHSESWFATTPDYASPDPAPVYLYCPDCNPHAEPVQPEENSGSEFVRLTVIETLQHHITVPVADIDRFTTAWRTDPEALDDDAVQEALSSLYINDIGDATVFAVPDRAVTTIDLLEPGTTDLE